MPRKCANCKEKIPDGAEFIVYGGLCWCGTDCLAEYYVEHEERFRQSGQRLEDVEQAMHYKVVTKHETATGSP